MSQRKRGRQWRKDNKRGVKRCRVRKQRQISRAERVTDHGNNKKTKRVWPDIWTRWGQNRFMSAQNIKKCDSTTADAPNFIIPFLLCYSATSELPCKWSQNGSSCLPNTRQQGACVCVWYLIMSTSCSRIRHSNKKNRTGGEGRGISRSLHKLFLWMGEAITGVHSEIQPITASQDKHPTIFLHWRLCTNTYCSS